MKSFLFCFFALFPLAAIADGYYDARARYDDVQGLIQQQGKLYGVNPETASLQTPAGNYDAGAMYDEVNQQIQQEQSKGDPGNPNGVYRDRLDSATHSANHPGTYGEGSPEQRRAYLNRLNFANQSQNNPNAIDRSGFSASQQAYQDRLNRANQDIAHPGQRRNYGTMNEEERAYRKRLNTATGMLDQSDNDDSGGSCDVTMCMFGMVAGGGGSSECSGSVGKFFGIQAFTGMGDFDPVKTEVKRKTFLKQCDKGVDNQIDSIISKFGQVQG